MDSISRIRDEVTGGASYGRRPLLSQTVSTRVSFWTGQALRDMAREHGRSLAEEIRVACIRHALSDKF